MSKTSAILLASGNIRLPRGRLSYPYILTPNPKAKNKDGKLKYTTSFLIPPGADLTVAQDAVANIAKEKFGDKLGDPIFMKKFKLPFLEAQEHMTGFNGWKLVRLSSLYQPGVVDHRGQPVTEAREIYAGRWAFLSVNPFTYDTDGNRGVSFGVVNIQLLEHDEPLAGSAVKAENEFSKVEIEGEQSEEAAAPKSATDIFGRKIA